MMYLDTSQHSLDICMYILTCQELAKAAERAFNRGVVVRVIVDATMADTDGGQNQVISFRKEGIDKLNLGRKKIRILCTFVRSSCNII